MSFATRADLLARSSANRVAQLACPTDMAMPPVPAVRAVLEGATVATYPLEQRRPLEEAVTAVDQALADAEALILSYGIPDTVQTTLLARLASTVAMYYLAGSKATTEETKTYEGVLVTLQAHAKGTLNLIPAAPTDPVPVTDDLAYIESGPRRYGAVMPAGDDW